MVLKNWYVKTDYETFYVENVKEVTNIMEDVCFYDEEGKLKLCIPEINMQYYFVCSNNKYTTLNTDLKRGVVHI